MSDGNRRDRYALIALAIALIAVVIVAAITNLSSPKKNDGYPHQQEPGGALAGPIPPSPRPLEEGDRPKDYEKPCAEGEENRNSDLCAQWKAADAAKESADWTGRTFFLGIFGTVIGGLTLLAAGFAAWYARHAAIETRRSADIAKDALDASKKHLRSYIHFTDGEITFQLEDRVLKMHGEINLRNSGNTSSVVSRAFMNTFAVIRMEYKGGQGRYYEGPFVIGPCLPYRMSFGGGIHIEEKFLTVVLYVGIKIEYRDQSTVGGPWSEDTWLVAEWSANVPQRSTIALRQCSRPKERLPDGHSLTFDDWPLDEDEE